MAAPSDSAVQCFGVFVGADALQQPSNVAQGVPVVHPSAGPGLRPMVEYFEQKTG